MMPLAVSQRRANFTSRSRKPSLPVNSRSLVMMGMGPLAPPDGHHGGAGHKGLLLLVGVGDGASVLGGSRYHQAIGRCTSSPTVISIVPSVPMMISPISGARAVEIRQKLVGADRGVSQLLALGVFVDQLDVVVDVAAVLEQCPGCPGPSRIRARSRTSSRTRPPGARSARRSGRRTSSGRRASCAMLLSPPGFMVHSELGLLIMLRCHCAWMWCTLPRMPLSTICFTVW